MSLTLDQVAESVGAARTDRAPRKLPRRDDWQNLVSGRGVRGQDPRLGYRFAGTVLSSDQAAELWAGDWLAARGVEIWPDEMLRAGWDLLLADDPGHEIADEIEQEADDLGLEAALWEALAFERAFGGAGVFLGINDGAGSLALPLDEERVRSFDFLLTLEPGELQVATWSGAGIGPDVGEPETYWLQTISRGGRAPVRELVHSSRVIRFPGIRVSRRQIETEHAGWGRSTLDRVHDVVRDFGVSWGSASMIVQSFARSEIKIRELYDLLANNQEQDVRDRLNFLSLARDVFGFDLLDAQESIEDKSRTVTGLADLLDAFRTHVAMAFDIPVSRITGQAPAGMNATGEFDQKAWYDRVESQRVKRLRRPIERVCRLLLRARGVEPKQLTVQFRPLFQESDSDAAAARLTQAKVDEIYLSHGVLSPDEVAQARFGGDTYSFETQIDPDMLSEIEPDEEDDDGKDG